MNPPEEQELLSGMKSSETSAPVGAATGQDTQAVSQATRAPGEDSPPSGPGDSALPSPGEKSAAKSSSSEEPATVRETGPSQRPGNVRDLLNDPVTLHMKPAAPLLRKDRTIGESLEQIRTSQNIGRVVYFYVVDEDRRLAGVIATRRLLLSAPETRVSEIMSAHIIAIPSSSTVLQACEYFTLHKLLAFPVIDEDRKILGAVDVDLYTDEIREIDRRQDSEDLFQLIGVHLSEAARGDSRLAFLGRFPWLLCNVGGGMLSALIADWYQDVSTLAVVAPFIALVTALSESVSIQSVSLSLQELHAARPNWERFARLIRMELFVSLLLGGACGFTVGLIAW